MRPISEILNFSGWKRISSINESSYFDPQIESDPELEALTKRVEEETNYSVARIMRRNPFFRPLIKNLEFVYTVHPEIDTAATDGSRLFVNPHFFSKMSPIANEFVVMHEIMHCVLLHFDRKRGRDHQKFNKAADYELNPMVVDELGGFDPRNDNVLHDILYDPDKYSDMSAEQIYDILPDEKGPGGKPGKTGPGGKPGGGGEILTPEEGNQIAKDIGLPGNNPAQQEEKWKKSAKEAIDEWNKSPRGRTGGAGNRLIDKLAEMLKPKVNWRAMLKKWIAGNVGDERIMKAPSRRALQRGEYSGHGLYRPIDVVNHVVVAIDASGSVIDLAPVFINEINNLSKLGKIDKLSILYWDDGPKAQEVLKRREEAKLKGSGDFKNLGGGTTFYPVSQYITKNYKDAKSVIIFTDAIIDNSIIYNSPAPPWKNKALWIVTKGTAPEFIVKPPYGKAIEYDPNA